MLRLTWRYDAQPNGRWVYRRVSRCSSAFRYNSSFSVGISMLFAAVATVDRDFPKAASANVAASSRCPPRSFRLLLRRARRRCGGASREFHANETVEFSAIRLGRNCSLPSIFTRERCGLLYRQARYARPFDLSISRSSCIAHRI